jgi:hypothetical protein
VGESCWRPSGGGRGIRARPGNCVSAAQFVSWPGGAGKAQWQRQDSSPGWRKGVRCERQGAERGQRRRQGREQKERWARQDEGMHSKATEHLAKTRAEQRCGARWISGHTGQLAQGRDKHSKVQGMGGKWRRYLSVPARCGGGTAISGTLANDGRCVVLPTEPRTMILAVVSDASASSPVACGTYYA